MSLFQKATLCGLLSFLLAGPALAGVCGDGVVERAEECDDANLAGGDGCSAGCEIETAGQRCEVTFSFAASVPLSVLQFTVDYSDADGKFLGLWQDVHCEYLLYPFYQRAGLDFDPEQYVRMYFLSNAGITGPVDIFACTFDIVTPAGARPTSSDLLIDVEDAADVDLNEADAEVFVSKVECRGGSLCGDGNVETFEACDDGNDSSGDGCSDECLVETCWDCIDSILGSACSPEPNRTPCSDGDESTTADQCLNGLCQQGCLAIPQEDCLAAGSSSLSITDSSNDARDSLKWKWKRGAEFHLRDIGDPTESARYSVCLYPDSTSIGGELAVPAVAGWERPSGVFQYKDRLGTAAGVTKIRLRAGDDGSTSLGVTGKGGTLPEGLLPTASYTIQLRDHETGACWSSTYSSGELREERFKASAP